jgi:TIR domain
LAGHVFISYSRRDAEYVTKLVEYLRAQGLTVWVDTNLDPGDRWNTIIREQIEASAVFVLVMTPAAETSEWVERELQYAQSLGRLIVPLLLDGKPFFSLFNRQHDNVVGGRMPSAELVAQLRDLTSTAAPPSLAQPSPAGAGTEPPLVFPGRARVTDYLAGLLTPLMFWVPVAGVFSIFIFMMQPRSFSPYLVTYAVVALASLTMSVISVWRIPRERMLMVSSAGLAVGMQSRQTFPWREFVSAEVKGDRLVALTTPDSWLVARADMRGRYDARLGGVVICKMRNVRATPQQLQQAVAQFAPH